MSASIEKQFRQFVRAQFAARLAHREDGSFDSSLKGKTARVGIRNPNTVLANLVEQCGKPTKETRNSTTFKFGGKKGQPTATITLAHVGDQDVLTMVNQ